MELRMTRQLLDSIIADLSRPHLFASERVGFVHGRLGNTDVSEILVLLSRYRVLPDDQYIDNPCYGACISGDAIRETMQYIRDRNGMRECAFHVHIHHHFGPPRMSRPDEQGLPPLIPSFARAGKDGAHGIIILSRDHAKGWVWLPGRDKPEVASRIAIIGSPMKIFEVQNEDHS